MIRCFASTFARSRARDHRSSPQGGVVSTLQESKIECLSADKDAYLYYFFLLRYPGRSLVFLSSIDGIRRLMPLTELLNQSLPAPFAARAAPAAQEPRSICTPDSSRRRLGATGDRHCGAGLDIPSVDHVIHYQIPRSADAYVHRNGRTARAMRKGFSMLMCAPDERRVVRALLGSLGRQEREIAEMIIELNLLDKLKERVQLARQIETTHHKIKKANHDRRWMQETAEALEVELDSDFVSDSDEEKPSNQRKAKDLKNASLKAELKRLLAQPRRAGCVDKIHHVGEQTHLNEAMVGIKKTEAGNDLVVGKRKKGAAPKVVVEDGLRRSGTVFKKVDLVNARYN
ncbi:hypothetical protein FB451DRAFT_1434163 [Mycena latifolia]|nr:hypothetical protein FB451DRAFT_1434163 [Mycena latifolia]